MRWLRSEEDVDFIDDTHGTREAAVDDGKSSRLCVPGVAFLVVRLDNCCAEDIFPRLSALSTTTHDTAGAWRAVSNARICGFGRAARVCV